MSNYKSTLQSNNTALNSNNLDLQSLIDQANALPEAGGVELPELTNEGTATDLLSGKQLIDQDGEVVTGTIQTKTSSNLTASGATVTVPAGYYATQATKSVSTATQATPSISVNSSGLITASATQSAGYVSAGTKSGTKQLTTQAAKTITPTKSSQTAVASGVYTTGAVTVGAIPSQYITTTDATASADEIMSGETAYVNGSKVTGTFSIDNEMSTQDSLISQIQMALQNKTAPSGGITLPTLSNPATAENLEEGYELIDEDGNIVVGTHVCEGGSGGGAPTFSVVNNLSHLLIVNGVSCPVGETTNNIPYGYLDLFFIVFEDQDDFDANFYNYCSFYDNNEIDGAVITSYSAYFRAESDDFITEFGKETYSCEPNIGITSICGIGHNNLCGVLRSPPWDEINNIHVDDATITFY